MGINAAQLMAMENAVHTLNEATKAYDEGHPIMSDQEWDNLYFKLAEWEQGYNYHIPESPIHTISYQVVSKLEKVKHNHPMLSLDKTKNWNEFLTYFNNINASKDIIGMVKLDGLTCSIKYENGILISAETRGNGEIGENILHNAKIIPSIPNQISYKDTLILDGEIICTYHNFEKFQDEYKNPRNFAAGSIRLLDSKECAARNLTFVVWNIIDGFNETNSFVTKLQKTQNLGFETVPWTSSFDWDAKEFLQEQAKELGYPIDGLVGRFDDIKFGTALGTTEHHAKAAYAFKFYDEEYETNLIDIEWSMGRSGVLTPVAKFEPIEIDGSIVERASLHNVSILESILGSPYFYQKIWVAKMNMIIPQVVKAEFEKVGINYKHLIYPEVCPICGQPTKIEKSDSGTENLVCTNPQCEGKFINRLDHFCGKTGLDIKGLSKKTLEKLIDWGWINEISDLYLLKSHESEWEKQPGFGKASVSKILSAIENSKNCELSQFLSAIGIPGIGANSAKELAKIFKSWNNFINAINDKNYHFYDLNGYGPETDYNLKHFNYSVANQLILNYIKINEIKEENVKTSLNGITFCITGKLYNFKNRDELILIIENNGGKISNTVSKNTNYLINNDITSSSSKNKSAKKLNIPILTEDIFIEKFLK